VRSAADRAAGPCAIVTAMADFRSFDNDCAEGMTTDFPPGASA
jgi:hypothetical protein